MDAKIGAISAQLLNLGGYMTILSRHFVPKRDDLLFPLEQHFNKFFDEFFQKDSLANVGKNAGFPKINAYEKEGELHILVSVSGMTSKDIRVEVDPENVLTLTGRMSEEYHSPDNSIVYFKELRASAFERRLQLPKNVLGDPVATLKDGMLLLKWKLQKEKPYDSKSKLIPIVAE